MPESLPHCGTVIEKALNLYLANHRVEAYELLDSRNVAHGLNGNFTDGPDVTSILRSTNAMINLVEGLLSGSADTISKCVDDFWTAEKLANESPDKEWIGNRISRGACYMFGGLLQVFVGSYVKAGINLTVAYKLIRDFENDVLAYSGEDKVIRSLGLLVLALLNFFSIVLPPSITTVGDYLGLEVSKDKFHKYISACNEEGGTFSFISKLTLVYYTINSKNFMFEHASPEELRMCRTLIDECLEKAPLSVVVRVMNANVCLAEGKPFESIKTLTENHIVEVIARPEWATMALATEYKLGVSHLCSLDFESAQKAFGKAADSVEKTGRWHYVPFMKTLEGMSYLASVSMLPKVSDVATIRKQALAIFAPTYVDREKGSTVVMPGDLWGSRVGYEHACMLTEIPDTDLEEFISTRCPVIDILYAMMTCLYQFDKILDSKLNTLFGQTEKFDKNYLKFNTVLGEYFRKIGKLNKAVAAFDDAAAALDDNLEEGGTDKDNILGFTLVFQGAALWADDDIETAKEVLADLDDSIGERQSERKGSLVGGLVKSLTFTGSSGTTSGKPIAGNLVNPAGGEFDLILSFRRNGLRRKLDNK